MLMNIPIDYELAEVLTERYNGYASMSEDLQMLEVEWVLERLHAMFLPEDLELLIDDEFGQGLIMGQIRVMHTFETMTDDAE